MARPRAGAEAEVLSELSDSKTRASNSLSMSEVTITLPDGSTGRCRPARPCAMWPRRISPRLAKAALAGGGGRPAGRSDVSRSTLTRRVRIVTTESPEALALCRHSTAHLLAAAVTNLFPDVQCGIGPATDEGLLLRLRRPAAVRSRGPRGHRGEDARARAAGPRRTSARCGHAKRPCDFSARAASR